MTELEGLRMKQRLLANPGDAEALAFFSVLGESKFPPQKLPPALT